MARPAVKACTCGCCAKWKHRCCAKCWPGATATRVARPTYWASIAPRCARNCANSASFDHREPRTSMTGSGIITARRALLSVSDKTDLADIGSALHALGIEIISTGGSAKALRDVGVPVRDVSELTGFPEIMDGRVKTLHPKVHGGLLGRRGVDDAVMLEHSITPIDLLIVNLYPFAHTVANAGVTYDDAI